MVDHLSIIIEYINDNIMFGSRIKSDVVENLFYKYPISDSEKEVVYEELASLNIVIKPTKCSLKDKLNRLFLKANDKKELKQDDLEKWFQDEHISEDMQKDLRIYLDKLGYSIIYEVHREIDVDDLDLCNLDDLLDNEEFQQEVSSAKDVVDKSRNIEYLSEFHNNEDNPEKRNKALTNIVKANGKLVWKIASQYRRFATVSLEEEDMFQIGMQGLLKAVEKFDISKGYQFSTYATWWIRQGITRAIADLSTSIRIPVHVYENISRLNKAETEFWNENGREGTNGEMAKLLGMTESKVEELKIYRNFANISSLDAPVSSDADSFLGEFIPDNRNKTPEDYEEENELVREIELILENRLRSKEQKVLSLRFGLMGGRMHTLEEIGQMEGVTRERIRQIEEKALGKLKNNKIFERLEGFYYD